MSFRINTNITAMNAYANANANQIDLEKSLSKLSSGLQIESAADNASGMTIADSLRAQANALGQSIKNANDASGIVETADNAMDEQISILDTIKTSHKNSCIAEVWVTCSIRVSELKSSELWLFCVCRNTDNRTTV